jgi:hypothetical protein
MARLPKHPEEVPQRRKRDKEPIIKPAGRFVRRHNISIKTDRSPSDVTKINSEDMKPILPEMPYIPPA